VFKKIINILLSPVMICPLLIIAAFMFGFNMKVSINKMNPSHEDCTRCATALSRCAFRYTESVEMLRKYYCSIPALKDEDYCNGK